MQDFLCSTYVFYKLYSLRQEEFPKLLQQAYISNSIDLINDEILIIQTLLKKDDYVSAREKYASLITLYQPLLKKHFHFIMSGFPADP